MRWTHRNFGFKCSKFCKYETQYAIERQGPDWSIIPSSGKSSKSKAEFTDEIKELARKAANTTSKAELEYIHRRRTELCAEYMSDVSPDRKALYRQAKMR
ncbi:hypothetical protein AALA79_18870 [Lachnospiraceae bacterium 64-25]